VSQPTPAVIHRAFNREAAALGPRARVATSNLNPKVAKWICCVDPKRAPHG